MYAALIPAIRLEDTYDEKGEMSFVWEGGYFQDGRAHNLLEQVRQPFFDPQEMNLPDPPALARRLRASTYADGMKRWVGAEAWKDDRRVTNHAFRALAEFLKEPMFRPFDARIDDYLGGDKTALNKAERRGFDVFKWHGKCAECHLLGTGQWPQPLLSDYGYDNVGAPSRGEPDPGLAGHTGQPGELGQFRAPSLRNVALTAPYLHNGSIATLKEVMEFYNKRDLEPARWGPTDYPATVNHDDLGNLGLSDQQIDDLTTLMDAFTDRSLLKMIEAGRTFPEAPIDAPSTASMERYFSDWKPTAE
jgi:cytochrome c peroxidase